MSPNVDAFPQRAATDLASIKARVERLETANRAAEYKAIGQWNEEKELIRMSLASLADTCKATRRDLETARTQMATLTRRAPDGLAHFPRAGAVEGRIDVTADELEAEQQRLIAQVETLKEELRRTQAMVGDPAHAREREIWETKLVIQQDTARMLREEIGLLEIEISNRRRAAELAAERAAREEAGGARVKQLQDTLMQLESKAEASKLKMYFPPHRGFRWSLGGRGMYVGGKDLTVAELGGGFRLSTQTVQRNGQAVALVLFELGAASGTDAVVAGGSKQHSRGASMSHNINDVITPAGSAAPVQPSSTSMHERTATPSNAPHSTTSQPTSTAARLASSTIATTTPTASPSKPSRMASLKSLGRLGDRGEGEESGGKRTDKLRRASKKYAMKFLTVIEKRADKYSNSRLSRDTTFSKDTTFDSPSTSSTGRAAFANRVFSGSRQSSANGGGVEGREEGLLRVAPQGGASDTSSMVEEGVHDSEVDSDAAPMDDARQADMIDHTHTPVTATQKQLEGEPPSSTTVQQPTQVAQHDLFHDHDEVDSEDDDDDLPPDTVFEMTDLPDELFAPPTTTSSAPSVTADDDTDEALEEIAMHNNRLEQVGSGMSTGFAAVVQCRGVHLVGEKGTGVPNTAFGELRLAVDFTLNVAFEYTSNGGWRSHHKPRLIIHALERSVRGNKIPLPKQLFRTLLAQVLPRVVVRKLAALLPPEFGTYLLAQHGGGSSVRAQLSLRGPSLAALEADLSGGEAVAAHNAALREACALLEITPQHAQVLANVYKHLHLTSSTNMPVTLYTLQLLQQRYASTPDLQTKLYQLWDEAMTSPKPFSTIMARVQYLHNKKPMTARFGLHHVDAQLDIDALLLALRNYTERTARDMAAPQENITTQIHALDAWYRHTTTQLNKFKTKFKSAHATALANANSHAFAAGLDDVHYEGPLHVKIPINANVDPNDGSVSFALPMPSPGGTMSRFVNAFRETLANKVMQLDEASAGPNTAATKRLAERMQKLAETDELIASANKELNAKHLGRVFVNRMHARLRIDEGRLRDVLEGLDREMMGSKAYAATVARLLSHTGDLLTLALGGVRAGKDSQFLMYFASAKWTTVRADLASLGFQSFVTPIKLVRMLHAGVRALKTVVLVGSGLDEGGAVEQFLERVDGMYVRVAEMLVRGNMDCSLCVDVSVRCGDGDGDGNGMMKRGEAPLVVKIKGVTTNKGEPIYPLVLAHELMLGHLVFRGG